MDSRSALTLSIGVLGGVAVAFTATVITVPIWVVFLAWASFFFVGGGPAGWVRSVASNLVGVVIAVASLYAAYLLGGSLTATAIAVGVGSALMVQASWVGLLSTTPAVGVGFASTVSTRPASPIQAWSQRAPVCWARRSASPRNTWRT